MHRPTDIINAGTNGLANIITVGIISVLFSFMHGYITLYNVVFLYCRTESAQRKIKLLSTSCPVIGVHKIIMWCNSSLWMQMTTNMLSA